MLNKDKKVWVYFNLHKLLFSVKQGNKVIYKTRNIILKDVEYVVWQSGRQRVLDERKKNVHAFVKGYVVDSLEMPPEVSQRLSNSIIPVTYNPYDYHTFTTKDGHHPVKKSEYAILEAPEGLKPKVTAYGAMGSLLTLSDEFPEDQYLKLIVPSKDGGFEFQYDKAVVEDAIEPDYKIGY